jgi:hypothetical protein
MRGKEIERIKRERREQRKTTRETQRLSAVFVQFKVLGGSYTLFKQHTKAASQAMVWL